IVHFSNTLIGFLRKKATVKATPSAAGDTKTGSAPAPRPASVFTGVVVPLLLVVLCLGGVLRNAAPPKDPIGQMRLQEFGDLPIVYQGRVKPFSTLARNAMVNLAEGPNLMVEQKNRKTGELETVAKPPIEWLMAVMSQSPHAEHYRVFRIVNLDLLEKLGLERRKGWLYSYTEITSSLQSVFEDINNARLRASKEFPLDAYEKALLKFNGRLNFYIAIREATTPAPLHHTPQPRQAMPQILARQKQLIDNGIPFIVPNIGAPDGWVSQSLADQVGIKDKTWLPYMFCNLVGQTQDNPHPGLNLLGELFNAYRDGDTGAFNDGLDRYRDLLIEHRVEGVDPAKLSFESFVNHFRPFYKLTAMYVMVFLLGCLSWIGWSLPLRRAAFWLLAFALILHTAAHASRVYISGYPPVTNLYSVAIFIGWTCALIGIVVEAIFKQGVGAVAAAVMGIAAGLVAYFEGGKGDTMQMQQAVLDTRFWLSTHVITITLGYGANFFAGVIGALMIFRGVITKSLDRNAEIMFGRITYGVICFALLLTFIGTVLGGLWADDSWGRFWGWDPKENGALIIVIWNALILHARWAGLIQRRGLAVMAVFGGVVTAWSYYGVNLLNVGLHSYGFTADVVSNLVIFIAANFVTMGLGLLPRGLWRSTEHDTA
ncbi:MAG: cytochrome c biogenesis protein, partial [Planctomycetota bacterium]